MSEVTFINANDFIEMLRSRGLVIVSAVDFELGKQIARKRILKRTSLTLKEIVDHNLLPLKSKKGVNDWIENGTIKESEVIRDIGPKKMIKVLTSAIKRLGYAE